jgi:hypothetical protein
VSKEQSQWLQAMNRRRCGQFMRFESTVRVPSDLAGDSRVPEESFEYFEYRSAIAQLFKVSEAMAKLRVWRNMHLAIDLESSQIMFSELRHSNHHYSKSATRNQDTIDEVL